MQTQNQNLFLLILLGTSIIVVLVLFILVFVTFYQQRMIQHQQQLRLMEQEKQQAVLQALFETQESERQRIARELHDGIGQVLHRIKFNLAEIQHIGNGKIQQATGMKEVIEDTKMLADDTIVEIRHIINNLLPPTLETFGLAEAFKWLSKKVQQTHNITVTYTAPPHVELKKEFALSLFRIVQELFSNAIRHSQAQHIQLTITQSETYLELLFTDDGVGFDKNNLEKHNASHGLTNIESRTSIMAADFHLVSSPHEGTSVKITLAQ
ncbi:MAG: sensor histidine kinase [Verrucomicrobia bacterium]|nr:sensor histidine kinase [Cytophagales bacterium]